MTSFTAQGTYQGFDTDFQTYPVDVFAKAPAQRSIIKGYHAPRRQYLDLRRPRGLGSRALHKPLPLLALTGKDLDGLKLDADLSFTAGIKQALGQWRAGFPRTAIEGHEVQVIQGTAAGGSRVKLFFDKQSGLLVRSLRYTVTIVGTVTSQIDYSDYREVAGVKVPFKWVATWTDGQTTTELSGVQPNARIDAAKLAKPAPAVPQAAAR